MRRQTNTINYSLELPLAQGIKFNILVYLTFLRIRIASLKLI